jgi:hypothetical protein
LVALGYCESRGKCLRACVQSCEKQRVDFFDLQLRGRVYVLLTKTIMSAIKSWRRKNVTESTRKNGGAQGLGSHFQKTGQERMGKGRESTSKTFFTLLERYNPPVSANQSGLDF